MGSSAFACALAWGIWAARRSARRRRFPSFAGHGDVSFTKAIGRISVELLTPFPPGIPAVTSGELYTQENVAYLQVCGQAGGFVKAHDDLTLQTLRVVTR